MAIMEEAPRISDGDLSAADALRVRESIARDLHDTVAQSLTTMLVEMEGFKAAQYGRASVIKSLDDLQVMARQALDDLRDTLYDLRDQSLYENDFLGRLDHVMATFTSRTGVTATRSFSDSWHTQKLTRTVANHLVSVIAEAANNAWRHGRARSIHIEGSESPEMAVVTVIDDGSGFSAPVDLVQGLGIRGMRERTVLIGADFVVESSDSGTAVSVLIPRQVLA
jgi:signal transduction histidine kinase